MDCSCSPVFRPSVDASSSISASLRVLSKIGFTFEGGGLQLGAWVARYQAHSKGNKLITRRNGWSLASVLDTDYVGQEGPSCIYVGPLETATKDTLEALYHQARDSYYSGNPLIVDDFFDKVELKLRWYGSKSVIKYPRCSLKRQSTYADAEADPSQIWALATIWISLLVIGIVALALPPVCTLSTACQDVAHLQLGSHAFTPASKSLTVANAILSIGLGSSIGYPIATAAVRALQGLWRNDLVALKGSCPSCGEEVFAFVRANKSVRPRHKTECHVCERSLVFHVKVEHSVSWRHNRWVYGRIYLVASTKDLEPEGSL